MIYFDNAATTALSPTVIEAMTDVMTSTFGNPSSTHAYGREASRLLREARQKVADILHVNSREIIFTSGGTESNNTAIKGYALANQSKGNHLITTAIEHHSVLHTMSYLEERFGFDVTYLKPVNGRITAKQIQDALREDTILVSVMYANNETGDLLPIKEIGQIVAQHQAVLHVDAVQALGKIPVHPKELNIDFLSGSAHKFHGPKGVGFLFAESLHFDSLLHGGEQEDKRRASTENLTGIVGLSQALIDSQERQKENLEHEDRLRKTLLDGLKDCDFYLNSAPSAFPYVVNLGFPKRNKEILLTQLDLAGFAVSTGSACTAGTVAPSHVLEATFGQDSHRLKESIRISFSENNTIEEVTLLSKKLIEIVGH